jgi:hypothetical protein
MLDAIARHLVKTGKLLKPIGENPRKVKHEQKMAERRNYAKMKAEENASAEEQEPEGLEETFLSEPTDEA